MHRPEDATLNHEIECWSRWLLHTRFRGPRGKDALDFLAAIRDRVLDRAQLRPGDYVLDVGSGDGLLAFGALHRVGQSGLVVVDDISQDVLDACARVAASAAVTDRMRFVRNSATSLLDIPDGSVDAVVTRSVLMYVSDKLAAAKEFRRVLRPGGRISLFEPISVVTIDRHRFGIDPGPMADLAIRVEDAFRALQLPETGSMVDYDERDLLRLFDEAGFPQLDLELRVTSRRDRRDDHWFDAMLEGHGNPRIPCLKQAIADSLTKEQGDQYIAYYRNAVATIGVTTRQAFAYLSGNMNA
jgi:ubiquinone/menaquinone biosynthesis C-methylase UbiE